MVEVGNCQQMYREYECVECVGGEDDENELDCDCGESEYDNDSIDDPFSCPTLFQICGPAHIGLDFPRVHDERYTVHRRVASENVGCVNESMLQYQECAYELGYGDDGCEEYECGNHTKHTSVVYDV